MTTTGNSFESSDCTIERTHLIFFWNRFSQLSPFYARQIARFMNDVEIIFKDIQELARRQVILFYNIYYVQFILLE